MQTNLGQPDQPRQGFWARLLPDAPTPVFDVTFGIIAPLLCLIFDPIVFRDTVCGGSSSLANYAPFVYTAIGLGMLTLAVWLMTHQVIRLGLNWLAGVFFTGAVLALILGILILPLSVVGLFICVGVFGFIPFLTALVYLRNAIRAARQDGRLNPAQRWVIGAMLTGMLSVLALPVLVQWQAPSLFPGWQAPHYNSCANE